MGGNGKKRPVPLAEEPAPNKRRSISTTSRDTTALNSPTEPPVVQYAPIDNHSYPLQADQAPMGAAAEAQLHSEHAQLAQIRHFNNSYAQPIDPSQHSLPNDPTDPALMGQNHEGGYHPNGQHEVNHAYPQPPQPRTMQRTLSMSLDGAAGTGTDEEKKGRKIANNNAANEKELRELIDANEHRPLESIARDVRNAERTQKAEKAKQLFAMRWLKQYCRRGHESVPRARVYTYYAQRCGNDRVDTLNPASFGKLVRIIFPGINTRRLGVRGESKYHYVNLALVEDPQPGIARPGSARMSIGSECATPVEPDHSFRNSARLPADSASFPQHENSFQQQLQIETSANPASQGHLFAESSSNGRAMYKQKLCFSHLNDQLSSNDALEFQLPNIARHVPAGFDIEQSHGLFELYRAHCTSLVDSVRYVKEKQFFKLIGSFNGTMTVPVARLFQQPPISAWIKDCDTVLYQQIIKFVSQLVLQVLPTPVFMMLRNIGNELIDVIKKHFYHFPTHVLEAKLETATIFCSLLQRMLRVNETAHAAANLLMKDDMRAIMWADWVSSIKPRRVVESSLARCGHEEAFNILTADMRLLLAPLPHDAIVEPSDFANATHVIGPEDWQDYSTADTIMERWSTFLKKLPARFPDVPTRTLLHCLESVGCAALRDITVNVAQSFGAWWTTKVWMDEMMLWLAEMGGFLDADGGGSSPSTNPYDDNIDSVMRNPLHEMPNNVSRPATASELPRPNSAHPNLEYGGFSGFSPQLQGQRHSSGPPTATFEFKTTPNRNKPVDDFEDSGIGMSLLGEGSGFTPYKGLTGTGWTPFKQAPTA